MLKNSLLALLSLLAVYSVGVEAKPKSGPRSQPVTVHAPEFDARSGGAALALIAGGTLLLVERWRRHKAKRD